MTKNNGSQGGALQYKNPNQTTASSALMNSPSDQICMGRNRLIIVGDRRVYDMNSLSLTQQTISTTDPKFVSTSVVNSSISMKTLSFTNPSSDSFTFSISALCSYAFFVITLLIS